MHELKGTKIRRGLYILAVTASALLSLEVFGQGGLSGQVLDQQGTPLEGVLILIKNEQTGRIVSVSSDEQGAYSFPNQHLTLGNHTISVRATGFTLAQPDHAPKRCRINGQADLGAANLRSLTVTDKAQLASATDIPRMASVLARVSAGERGTDSQSR